MWLKTHPWVFPGIIGGIHILIAGLISPCKWLALLCVVDYTFWSFLYAVHLGCFRKNKG